MQRVDRAVVPLSIEALVTVVPWIRLELRTRSSVGGTAQIVSLVAS